MAEKPKNKKGFNLYWIYAILAVVLIAANLIPYKGGTIEIQQSDFEEMALKGYVDKILIIKNKEIAEVYLDQSKIDDVKALDSTKYQGLREKKGAAAKNTPDLEFQTSEMQTFEETIKDINAKASEIDPSYEFKVERDVQKDWAMDALSWLLFPLLLIVFWIIIMRRMSGGGGGSGGAGNIFSIGKSRAKVFEKGKGTNITFKDVAGLEGAKEEIEEIVDFLKNPKKYTELGAKIPKGALLVGPPGTGKTLLAKAVAGEAKVPFFSLSGSDFVEMFVGVGASRVRDLFKQAKEKAPSIIFIDEIDAIGRARGKNANMGSNDERENTLNQLLTEMDGFGTNTGVIILAATNRADVLDSALMRAGRFDRQIYVDMPDFNERKEIFQVHLRPLKLEKELDIDFLARQTPGFSGADIANICNEAALIAARKKKKFVEKQDFLDAVDRIVGGLEKKNKIISPQEKKTIAFHEAGHATTSWLLEHASPLVKVTIVPRGRSLGAAWYLPEERQITTTEQLLDEMCSALGGRAAEEIMFGKISTGALSDLEKVTKQAYAMVSIYGLSEKIGNISYYDPQGNSMFQKPYSEDRATAIDQEVSRIIEEQYERAKKILTENKDKLVKLAEELLQTEVIFKDNLVKIFGERIWDKNKEKIEEHKIHENGSDDVEVEEKPISNEDTSNDESVSSNDSSGADQENTAPDSNDSTDENENKDGEQSNSL
ncbi:ATP-dependent zinc metalloprotease FtsH [Paracrocinitomix mangrovi]|uniref:ATP-dependent zinc metalloprotease FtsH n=1 Tax=Paracrocinitomix mangrovi TaxID=2862509 RepID=UPI001C8E2DAC|nr:ATP-dependent zinc metalloprotease FtsH [Paracrocinitomix mangrovi]UKN01693.1 ATP-dependent zinc metalloprotease FtsH [Paracrocinitomix mangrovi]